MIHIGKIKITTHCTACKGDIVMETLEKDVDDNKYRIGWYCINCSGEGTLVLDPLDDFIEMPREFLGMNGIKPNHGAGDDEAKSLKEKN